MRKFEIEMDIHFTKTLRIEAPNEDAATVLAETMLLCTDAEDDDESEEDEEERIDELVHKLMEALEDATDAMGSAIAVADALKEITGEDIFSQMMK